MEENEIKVQERKEVPKKKSKRKKIILIVVIIFVILAAAAVYIVSPKKYSTGGGWSNFYADCWGVDYWDDGDYINIRNRDEVVRFHGKRIFGKEVSDEDFDYLGFAATSMDGGTRHTCYGLVIPKK